MKIGKLIISALCSIIILSTYSYAAENSNQDEHGGIKVLKFGVLKSSRLPFWSGDSSVPIGLQHDITMLVAQELDSKVDYVEFESISDLKAAISDNSIDLAVGFTIESGWKNTLYSEGLFKEPLVAWTNLQNIRNTDLQSLSWGCVKETLSCKRLEDLGYQNIIQYPGVQNLFDEIASGNIDSILGIETSITDYAHKTKNKVGHVIYDEIFGYYVPRIISNDNNYKLINEVNEFIKKSKRNKYLGINNILQQYGYFPNLLDESSYNYLDEKIKKIRYTISDNVYPLSYYDDIRKSYAGFIHDFMRKLSHDTPLEFIYVPPNGKSIEAMLINGEVDILPAMNSKLVSNKGFIKTSTYTSVDYTQIETKADYEIKKLAALDRINILPIEILDKNILIYKSIDKLLSDLEQGVITNAYLNEYLVSSLVNNKIDSFNVLHNASNLSVELSLVLNKEHDKLRDLLNEILRSTPRQEVNNIWNGYKNVQITWDFDGEVITPQAKMFAMLIVTLLFVTLSFLVLKIKSDNRKNKLAIENVRVKNRWLNQLINSIPSMICIFNKDEVILYNSKYKEVMYECGFENSSKLIEYIIRGCDIDTSSEFEKTIHITDHESPLNDKTYYLVNSEIEISSSKNSNYLLVINDITMLKSREKSLIAANEQVLKSIEAQNHFLAVISHELRTPISAMLGLMEILQTRLIKDEDITILSNAVDSANRLKLLVNDILDYSKLDAMQVKIIPEECNVAHELGQLIRGFEASANLKGVNLILDWKPTKYLIASIDTMRLGQIVTNILSNAVKFTSTGFISVSVDISDSTLYLSVRDTGIGMSKKQQETIFEPFVQAEDGIARTYGGTGLGMSIVANLLSLMQGTICVHSELNLGTLVEVEIPIDSSEYKLSISSKVVVTQSSVLPWLELFDIEYILDEDGTESESNIYPDKLFSKLLGSSIGNALEISDMPLLKGKVLVVDDDLINRFLIDKQLVEFGLDVTLTSGGKEALSFLEDQKNVFDLVITDCHMPCMSGYELTKQIRQSSSEYKNIPVIACTADNSPSVEQKAKRVGINEVMYKPYDLMQLHRTIEGFLVKNYIQHKHLTVNSENANSFDWLDNFQGEQKKEMAIIVVESLTEGLNDLQKETCDVGMVAHRVKGSASALGITYLFDLAYKLEQTPDDKHTLDIMVDTIQDIINKTKNYIAFNME